MASLREKLASFIMEGTHTILEWTTFQKQMPNLQLKTVSHGEVLISFNNEGFERPEIWLGNFQARCIERFETEKKKLLIVLPKERQNEILYTNLEGDFAREVITKFQKCLDDYGYSAESELRLIIDGWFLLTDCCGIDRDDSEDMLTSLISRWNEVR